MKLSKKTMEGESSIVEEGSVECLVMISMWSECGSKVCLKVHLNYKIVNS